MGQHKGSLELITGPTVEPVTTSEAIDHLRVGDSPPDQTLIDSLITAATAHIDGRDGWLGRQIITATWEYYLDEFPFEDFIRLPLAPVQSITSIKYIDTDGVEQTLSESDADHGWQLSKDLTWRPRIDLKHDKSWPPTRVQRDAVRIRFVAGYSGDGASPEDLRANVPTPIKQAILLLIGHLYENREAVLVSDRSSTSAVTMPLAVEALLTPYRRWGF